MNIHNICLRFDHLGMVDPLELFSTIKRDLNDSYTPDIDNPLITKEGCFICYALSEEYAKTTNKLHYHAYLQYYSENMIDSEMRRLRRFFKNEGYEKHLFCVQKLKRRKIMYLTYMFKDGNILSHNLSQDEHETVLQNIDQFNELKALPMREQLEIKYLEVITSQNEDVEDYNIIDDALAQTDAAIGSFIIKEFCDRGHQLPYPFHMKQYISHIQLTLFKMCPCEIWQKVYK